MGKGKHFFESMITQASLSMDTVPGQPIVEIAGTGSLVGCRLWGHTESDTTEVT